MLSVFVGLAGYTCENVTVKTNFVGVLTLNSSCYFFQMLLFIVNKNNYSNSIVVSLAAFVLFRAHSVQTHNLKGTCNHAARKTQRDHFNQYCVQEREYYFSLSKFINKHECIYFV